MKRYSLKQTQLYALFLFSGTIPVLTLVLGFHLAWQYHDTSNAAVYPVVQTEQTVVDAEQTAVKEEQKRGESDQSNLPHQALDPSNTTAPLASIDALAAATPSVDKPAFEFKPQPEPQEAIPRQTHLSDVSEILSTDQAFALQLGAFESKDRAIAWATAKRTEHDDVHLLKREVNGRVLFTVAVGHFDQKDLAREAQKKLASSLGVSSYVIEYRQSAKEIVLSS